jgi:hypothetical protein
MDRIQQKARLSGVGAKVCDGKEALSRWISSVRTEILSYAPDVRTKGNWEVFRSFAGRYLMLFDVAKATNFSTVATMPYFDSLFGGVSPRAIFEIMEYFPENETGNRLRQLLYAVPPPVELLVLQVEKNFKNFVRPGKTDVDKLYQLMGSLFYFYNLLLFNPGTCIPPDFSDGGTEYVPKSIPILMAGQRPNLNFFAQWRKNVDGALERAAEGKS